MPAQTPEHGAISEGVFFYGPSMYPTLRPGDTLLLTPCTPTNVRLGDVIVFPRPCPDRLVVHRIVGIQGNCLTTRGDNNPCIDPWTVPMDTVLGRVTHAVRGSRQRRISGGVAGRGWSLLARAGKQTGRAGIRLLRPFYRQVARSSLAPSRWLKLAQIRAVTFARSNGNEYRLYFGSRVIGRRGPHDAQWRISPPYRLFVDETRLNIPTGP